MSKQLTCCCVDEISLEIEDFDDARQCGPGAFGAGCVVSRMTKQRSDTGLDLRKRLAAEIVRDTNTDCLCVLLCLGLPLGVVCNRSTCPVMVKAVRGLAL